MSLADRILNGEEVQDVVGEARGVDNILDTLFKIHFDIIGIVDSISDNLDSDSEWDGNAQKYKVAGGMLSKDELDLLDRIIDRDKLNDLLNKQIEIAIGKAKALTKKEYLKKLSKMQRST